MTKKTNNDTNLGDNSNSLKKKLKKLLIKKTEKDITKSKNNSKETPNSDNKKFTNSKMKDTKGKDTKGKDTKMKSIKEKDTKEKETMKKDTKEKKSAKVNSEEKTQKKEKTQKSEKELSSKELQEQGNIAADYIEGILDIANLEGDIEIEINNKRATISVIADNLVTKQALRKLSQKDVVNSLQNLSRMTVFNKTKKRSKLLIDVAGYREQQRSSIERLVEKMIDKAKNTNNPIHLHSMNSFERRIAHQIVSESGLFSHSEGTGKDRHLIITLDKVSE